MLNYIKNEDIKQEIIINKQKLKKGFHFYTFQIELIKNILKEKIKNKDYKLIKNFIIIEFYLNQELIIIKYNKQKNVIFIFINKQNILNKYSKLKREISKIFSFYGF